MTEEDIRKAQEGPSSTSWQKSPNATIRRVLTFWNPLNKSKMGSTELL